MPSEEEKKLKTYTCEEVGEFLGCSTEKVKELIRRGDIVGTDICTGERNETLRVSAYNLEQFINNGGVKK